MNSVIENYLSQNILNKHCKNLVSVELNTSSLSFYNKLHDRDDGNFL